MIIVNGENKENLAEKSIIDALRECGFNDNRIVVELNKNILPKQMYQSTFLKDGDVLEIVCFVGGG